MSWNARRASFVLLALIVAVSAVWLDPGHAQVRVQQKQAVILPAPPPVPPPPGRGGANLNPDGFLNNGIHLVKDEKGRGKQIEAAIDYINDEDWAIAIERLQKLLVIEEDVFVRLKRKNVEGNEVFVWVSAKQEADRLIATLPAAGKDFYKATYGAKAARSAQEGQEKRRSRPAQRHHEEVRPHRRRRRCHQVARRLQIRSRRIHARSAVLQQAH